MKKYTSFLIIFFTVQALFAYNSPASSGGQFLGIGVSPRAEAMASAFISVSEGAEAIYYNPSATAWSKGFNLSSSSTQYFADIKHHFLAVTYNKEKIGTFGFLFTGLVTDEMKVRTPLRPDGTGETFYAGSYRVGMSYAKLLTNRVSFGGSVNLIESILYDSFSANAVFIDISILYVTGVNNFKFGMKIENFGSELTFINESYPLPTNFQFGLSLNVIEKDNYSLLTSFTAKKTNDGEPQGFLGGELNWKSLMSFRMGYKFNDPVANYSCGFGIKTHKFGYDINFDYSFNDYELLNNTQSIGVSLKF